MVSRVATESARRVSRYVTELLRTQPFFGSLALRLPIRPDPSRKTLASDGQEIRYSPQWIAETDAHLVETAIARVMLSCALKHHTRRHGRDPERWQRASQLVTHALLRDAGFTLPDDAEAWKGLSVEKLSVEEAYDRLPDPEPRNGGSGNGTQPGSGRPETAGTDDIPDDNLNDHPDDSGHSDDPGDQDDSADHEDSSDPEKSADGEFATPESHDPSGTGEIMDAAARHDDIGVGEAGEEPDATAEEQIWDEAMHQALSLAKAEGKVPGQVRETIQGAHTSTLDWKTLLRRYMTDTLRRDYSWSVPNRRFIDDGLYMPSIRSEGMECIAVIIDTSASIRYRPQILERFWSEVRQLAGELQGGDLLVLQVDTIVQDIAEYGLDDLPEEIAIRGGGGTDFRPGFAWLEEQDRQPGICLYLTDMECSAYPETEPCFQTLWCNWGNPPGTWNREPWGERIDMADIVKP